MTQRNRSLSSQAISVLDAIAMSRQEWSYGLEISKATGLKSGSLYPILMRFAERGLLESCWLEPEKQGRPPRHGYKITKSGLTALAACRKRQSQFGLREEPV